MTATKDTKKCKCGRPLHLSEDGINYYCYACKEYYARDKDDPELIAIKEGKFGA